MSPTSDNNVENTEKSREPRPEVKASFIRRLMAEEMDDLRTSGFWRAAIAEFLGCLLLLIFMVGFTLHEERTPAPSLLQITLASSFFITIIVASLLHVSGAHINPAISISLAATREISIIRFLVYLTMQSSGSIAGVALLKSVIPSSRMGGLGVLNPGDNVSLEQALLMEFIITFFLLFIIRALSDKNRNDIGEFFPLTVALTVAVNIFFAGEISGAAMNPIRHLGPAVLTGRLEKTWIYWVGPILGGLTGTFTYDRIFSPTAIGDTLHRWCLSSNSYSVVTGQNSVERSLEVNNSATEKERPTSSEHISAV